MNQKNAAQHASLESTDGHPVPLTGIEILAVIDDVRSGVTVRQSYKNQEKKNIEAVYTFPLPLDAVLLDFTVSIGGTVRHGTVMKKKQARTQYEDAVEQGDTAAMLEEIGDGLFSMSVGNILAGQSVEITFRYSQFNIWNGTLLRFFLPTVIAPKYGSHQKAGIEDYQAPVTSLEAQNAWHCTVEVRGEIRSCAVTCPTHSAERHTCEDHDEYTVSAFADRDFVMEIRADGQAAPRAGLGRDLDGYVAAVAMTPDFSGHLTGSRKEPRDIDIIIDCSGSMTGDSIAQARIALGQILSKISEGDSFNITRFGSSCEMLFPGHVPYTESSLSAAKALLKVLDANLGGTEMQKALQAVFSTHIPGRRQDILLITDGELYENEEFFAGAASSGCRIFVVGVGSAVSEAFLCRLARVTRGMAEFVTPGEDMAEKIVRHFQRMSVPALKAEITWPDKAEWTVPDEDTFLFHGDTTVWFARFAKKPCGSVKLRAGSGSGACSWSCRLPDTADETTLSDLARMAVRRRITGRTDDEAADIAVKYNLLTPLTSYLLVEKNADGEELDLPELRTVKQMMAAGYGGFGSARLDASVECCCSMLKSSFSEGNRELDELDARNFRNEASRKLNKLQSSAPADSAAEGLLHGDTDWAGADAGMHIDTDTGTPALENLARTLAVLDRPSVKALFARKSIDALAGLGLPEDTADRLRAIAAMGVSEKVLFVRFLESVLAEYPYLIALSTIGPYISRSVQRLTDAEKAFPDQAEAMFKGIFGD